MKQLTVIAPNKPGILAAITSIFLEHGVNIEAFDVQVVNKTGVINLTVDNYDIALRALKDHGYKAITEDTLIVRLADKPGALAVVAMRLKNEGLDLRSMHIIRREGGDSIVSLVTSDNGKAAALLSDVILSETQHPGHQE